MIPQVSIVIPAYNSGQFLDRAIQSVLEQTYGDFEIVLIDDGSTDDTPATVARFANPRLRYFRQDNRGLPAARNAGLRMAQGEYVAFLDADDWFLPQKLTLQVSFLDRHSDVGLVASGWMEFDEHGILLRTHRPWLWQPELTLERCIFDTPLVVHSVLVRKHWLDAIGGFDESLRWVEDWDLWLRLLLAGCRFEWLPEVVCGRLIHSGNMSRNALRMREGGLAVLDKLSVRPDLPGNIRDRLSEAYAAVHLSSAARFLVSGDHQNAWQSVRKAVSLNEALLEGEPCVAAQALVGWADSALIEDKEAYQRRVVSLLSPLVPSGQLRQVCGAYYLSKVFQLSPRPAPQDMRHLIIQGVRWDPSWLRNVGVLSLAVEAFLGPSVARRLRSVARRYKQRAKGNSK